MTPLCYRCQKREGIRWKGFYYQSIERHLKLCMECNNRFFTPEGFIQFGYTLEEIAKIAKEGRGY